MIEDNDLLAELNGTAATPQEGVELANAEKEAKHDPLAVPAPKKKSAAKRAAEQGTAVKGYAITVEGDYAVASTEVPGKKMKKQYSITVNVPELEGALSTIKNKLLDKVLKMKYPGYLTYYTHEIVDTKPLTADTPPAANVAYMNLAQLQNHVRDQRLPIDVEKYGSDVKNLRAAVVDCVLNPGGFVEREKKRLVSIAEDKALEALNNIPGN
jgi:hypothetical protein